MPRHRAVLSRSLSVSLRAHSAEFLAFTSAFAGITARRDQMAPPFLKLWRQYERETRGSFVAFVRELDPDVPAARAGYTRHRSFQAALYLRRLAEAPGTQAKYRQTLLPFDLLARVIKGVLPLVHPHEPEAWAVIKAASGWRERDLRRLEQRVEKAEPVELPLAPRLRRREVAASFLKDSHRHNGYVSGAASEQRRAGA